MDKAYGWPMTTGLSGVVNYEATLMLQRIIMLDVIVHCIYLHGARTPHGRLDNALEAHSRVPPAKAP